MYWTNATGANAFMRTDVDFNIWGQDSNIDGIEPTGAYNLIIGDSAGGAAAGTALEGSNNIALGLGAMGNSTVSSSCIAIGSNTLYTQTSTDTECNKQNIAIGTNALTNANGDDPSGENINNIAIGYVSCSSLVTGKDNIALGTSSMAASQSSNNCVAIGTSALSGQTEGTNNIAIGYQALDTLTTGTNNVVIGNTADSIGTSNSFNVTIGHGATVGNNNCISIGYLCVATDPNSLALGALSAVQGSNSIAIGYNSAATGTSQNVTVIGPNSTIQGNDAVLIGSVANVSGATGGSVFIKHRVLASVGNVAHFVPGGGGSPITTELYENSSSQRYKMDIKDYEPDLKKFEQIRPVIYRAKPGFSAIPNDQRYYPGFIAEEINTVFPEYVAYDSDGITPANVFYDKIVTLLVKKVQELEREIKEIKQNLN